MSPTNQTADIVREIRLIFSDIVGNNNKFWRGTLKRNGDVYTEWGRVGKAMQTKTYPGAGPRKLDEKEREKLNKGYTHAQVVAAVQGSNHAPVQNHNLLDLAIKQISKGEPLLTRVITQLVNANIHKITSQSQITYNNTTGMFQTPLGVVTMSAILQAYDLLNGIQTALQNGDLNTSSNHSRVNQYLRLIPQDFGMRLNLDKMFPDDNAIQKQRDLLDTLEASYKMVTSPKKAEAKDGTPASVEEALFEVSIRMSDPKETDRIRRLYNKTKQSMHHYVARMDVKQVYEITMPTQHAAFDAHGAKMSNVWELWHGTKMCNVLNILRTGLKILAPNAAPKAGSLFGSGCYFSDVSSKSLNYATDYWHGGGRGGDPNFFMFLAMVAMGNYHVPSGQRNSPPPKGYDSYFAKPGHSGIQNNEMIVFKESQFKLVRLVEFSEGGK